MLHDHLAKAKRRRNYVFGIMLTFLILLSVTAHTGAAPQPGGAQQHEPFPITVSFDPYRSIDTGADLTFGAITGLAMLEDRAFSRLKRSRRTNIPLGIAKTVLLDHPIAVFMIVLQHEVFGHGGRARELRSAASFRMGTPWTVDALFKGGTRFGGGASWERIDTPRERLHIYIGGTEANSRSATFIERELVAGRSASPLQLLYFIRSRWYPSQYVLRTPHPVADPAGFFNESNGGDVATYLGDLNRKYYGETGITPQGVSPTLLTEYRRLRRQAWINLAGPGAWLALWNVARLAAIGEEPARLPVPRIAGRRFLPVVTADWIVDGGAISVEAIFGPKRGQTSGPRWFSFNAREGNGPGGRFWGAGAATEMFATWKSLRMGGEVEVWNQPASGPGAGASTRMVVTRGLPKGLLFDVGVKSDGHWPGRPVEPGAFIRVGYRYVRTY